MFRRGLPVLTKEAAGRGIPEQGGQTEIDFVPPEGQGNSFVPFKDQGAISAITVTTENAGTVTLPSKGSVSRFSETLSGSS